MKKIGKWIKKNIGLFVVLLLTLVLLVFILIIFIKLLMGNNSDKYGNRLDGIDEVKISSETYDGVEKELMDTGLVEDASVRLQGKIVYTTIVLKSDTGVATAKELAGNTLDNYTQDELKYYDFSFFLKWEGEEGDSVITGNRHHDLDNIAWVRS